MSGELRLSAGEEAVEALVSAAGGCNATKPCSVWAICSPGRSSSREIGSREISPLHQAQYHAAGADYARLGQVVPHGQLVDAMPPRKPQEASSCGKCCCVTCGVLLLVPCLLFSHLLGAPRVLPEGTLSSWGESFGKAVSQAAPVVGDWFSSLLGGGGGGSQPGNGGSGDRAELPGDNTNSSDAEGPVTCDGEPHGWLLEKRRRCCHQVGRGCSSGGTYNCQEGKDKWEATWPLEKKHFCCGFDLSGCVAAASASSTTKAAAGPGQSTTAPSPVAPPGPSTTEPAGSSHKCEVDLEHWLSKWSPAKKAYCCTVFNFGCEVTTTSVPYDCNAEFAHWASAWSSAKKSWCCLHERVGCEGEAEDVASTKPPENGCQARCEVDGNSATCTERINWMIHEPPPKGVLGQPIKCQSALAVVIKDCQICATCSLAETECGSPDSDDEESYECNGGGTESWHAARSTWCCIVQGIACPAGVSPGNFECVTDQADWGQVKKDWCCARAKVGCKA